VGSGCDSLCLLVTVTAGTSVGPPVLSVRFFVRLKVLSPGPGGVRGVSGGSRNEHNLGAEGSSPL
jgi:hypothetical protein